MIVFLLTPKELTRGRIQMLDGFSDDLLGSGNPVDQDFPEVDVKGCGQFKQGAEGEVEDTSFHGVDG